MAQSCFQPADPDITGIGVRVSVYISFLVTLFVNVYSHIHEYDISTPEYYGLQRVKTYTMLSIAIAMVALWELGQLSVFHSVAAAHLLYLNLTSALVQRAYRTDGAFSSWAIVQIIIVSLFGGLSTTVMGEQLECSLQLANGTTVNGVFDIHWTLFMGLEVSGRPAIISPMIHLMGFVILAGIAYSLCLWLVYKGDESAANANGGLWIGVAAFFLYWLAEVVGLERSLQNQEFVDRASENQWGFGQITAVVLLLNLVDPALALIKEIDEEESETESTHRSSEDSNRSHHSTDSRWQSQGPNSESIPMTTRSASLP